MKQKTLVLTAALMTLLVYSCKKDSDSGAIPDAFYPNYSQLKVGNYWVYEQFDIDNSGNATSNNTFDSCYVEKDTIINGKTYFKLVKPKPYLPNQQDIFFQRDSLHYTVNANGKIAFSSLDFSTVFDSGYITAGPADTICKIVKQMGEPNLSVTTPAGTFTTLTTKDTYFMYPNWKFAGDLRFVNTRYTENIGIVIETLPFFASVPNYIERRLIRYQIN
ncbi:MAG: hypothetical protein IPN36_02105 [Bacteroidetes bacterium]|nr:hypothetical protein [Bacteroidota bacterium]